MRSGVWHDRARAAAAARRGVADAQVSVSPLGLRPGREVYLCTGPGWSLVAKCYPDGSRAHAAAEALRLAGGRHGTLLVPGWQGTDGERDVVLQDFVAGQPLGALLGGPRGLEMAGRVGSATADLHALAPSLPRHLTRGDAVAGARERATSLTGEERRIAERAFLRAAARLDSAPADPPVPSHGDLGWAQLLACGTAVGMVDFDKSALAEPALDLGNLVAQVRRGWPGAAPALEQALLEAYDRRSDRPADGGLVRAYAALVLVRKLAYLAPARRDPVRRALAGLAAAGR